MFEYLLSFLLSFSYIVQTHANLVCERPCVTLFEVWSGPFEVRFYLQYSFGRVDSLAELCNSPYYTILDIVITEGCSFCLVVCSLNTVHGVQFPCL